jgi:hypothetical protein
LPGKLRSIGGSVELLELLLLALLRELLLLMLVLLVLELESEVLLLLVLELLMLVLEELLLELVADMSRATMNSPNHSPAMSMSVSVTST